MNALSYQLVQVLLAILVDCYAGSSSLVCAAAAGASIVRLVSPDKFRSRCGTAARMPKNAVVGSQSFSRIIINFKSVSSF